MNPEGNLDSNVETLYPDLPDKYSPQERQFLAQITQAKPPQSSGFTQQIPQQQQSPQQIVQSTQNFKHHTIKSLQAWKVLVKEVVNWVNGKIHPMRVMSFAVVKCHSTTAGQCTIFYDDSKSDLMRDRLRPYLDYCLSAAIVETGKSWDKHHDEVAKTCQTLIGGGNIIMGVSELETGMTHNKATSVIWFLKRY